MPSTKDQALASERPPLSLGALVGAELEEQAARAYPHEACGLLVGRRREDAVEVVRAVTARNMSARPRHGYEVPPEDWCAAYRDAARSELDIVGVWHSHPDGVAVPSRADAESAWPEYCQLIVAASSAGATGLRSWYLERGALREQRVLVRR